MQMVVLTYWWCEECDAVILVRSTRLVLQFNCPHCKKDLQAVTNAKDSHKHLIVMLDDSETYEVNQA